MNWIRLGWQWIDRKIFLALLKRITFYLLGVLDRKIDKYGLVSGWKQKVLNDFKTWLSDMPAKPTRLQDAPIDSTDLYTLLAEFCALRQEIKLQNREQHKEIQTLGNFIDSFQEAMTLFKDKSEHIELLEIKIRQAAEKKAVLPFLDVRDALLRGQKAAKSVINAKHIFRRKQKGINGILEGYEMSLRRLDRAFAQADIFPLQTINQPFDPKTMRAVAKVADSTQDHGIVIDEHVSGYVKNDEVLRVAEVVVNE